MMKSISIETLNMIACQSKQESNVMLSSNTSRYHRSEHSYRDDGFLKPVWMLTFGF